MNPSPEEIKKAKDALDRIERYKSTIHHLKRSCIRLVFLALGLGLCTQMLGAGFMQGVGMMSFFLLPLAFIYACTTIFHKRNLATAKTFREKYGDVTEPISN